MNAEGPVNWYLSVKYDRDPITGAVSAHQHLYIDKLLKKWGMEQCNPLPTPFPQKADDIVEELAQPVAIHDDKLVKEYQSLVGSFPLSASTHIPRNIVGSISTKQMLDSTLPYTSCHRQETSALPQSSQEHHSTMVRSRMHWVSQANHNLWLCRRILCRYSSSSTLISRICLHAQRSCYFLTRQ